MSYLYAADRPGEADAMAKDDLPRLRAPALHEPPQIVLIEPEIPQNTGNIARLAGALACPLHLVGELGFRIDDKAVRRAGLDYWHLVDVRRHESLDAFVRAEPEADLKLFTAVGKRSYLEASYAPSDALIFGRESRGLPMELLEAHPERCFALPTMGAVRSLNLANTVAVVVYEAMRQLGAFDELALTPLPTR
jgi:tRNA (cytidine/uridine-2'-O-)-methyltransferase